LRGEIIEPPGATNGDGGAGLAGQQTSVADEQGYQHPAEHRQVDLDEGMLQLVEAPFELVEATTLCRSRC
jgi:hypothetical protein